MLCNIRSMGRVLVAYSGGVDSTFLLLALIESGTPYQGVIAISPTMPTSDYQDALMMAKELNANCRVIESGEMDDENFVNNPLNRCFYCKNDLFKRLTDLAIQDKFDTVVDGTTLDDLGDYRPGLQAKNLHKVRSPLAEAGFDKNAIRELSRQKGLRTWNKPASPCLSSRFSYGERIELEGLRRVESAENKLKELGFRTLRVRKQGDTARIELLLSEFPRILEEPIRQQVVDHFRTIGFLFITLDLEGFQSGKLNRMIPIHTGELS
ncbi:MAG: ATP-dependent sacrificial sulfur transferase LarE [Magnetococcales bacterium]|nr:ATP-dependent sacrificial sulfur transferase LarE [Magnetococcales bacterium]